MAGRKTFPISAALAALLLAPGADAQDVARGEVLYAVCAQCHGDAGEGSPLALAPSIAALGEWYLEAQLQNFRKGVRGTHPDDVGGLRMHPMSLFLRTDEDVKALAAFVSRMPPPVLEPTVEGDAAKGASYYVTCQACHGADGAGNQLVKAPRLVGTSDWYLVEALKKYKAGVRGGNSGNPNSVMMAGMAASLPDDQAINDVVAHILTLGE
jgi:cytochrome c553